VCQNAAMVVSVTRLHLISWRSFPLFLWYSMSVVRQARGAPGFRGGWLGGEGGRGNWTSTVWESADAILAFRNSGAHLTAMPRMLKWCDEASYVHWEQADGTAPSGEVAYKRLGRDGKPSKVTRPSAQQAAGKTVGVATPKAFRVLKPTGSAG
jgi:hypothetical protein